jgi:hypothetical protein
MRRNLIALAGIALILPVAAVAQVPDIPPGPDDPVAYARSAGPPEISAQATVVDAEGNVLEAGTNGWTCMHMPGAPMCVDAQWMAWLDAYVNQTAPVGVTGVGIAYMLRGDQGASNIDPYATAPTADNEWVTTGPHIMLIVPDPSLLDGIPSDPESGGPYVMWRGHPLVHVMIPVEANGVEMHQHRVRP